MTEVLKKFGKYFLLDQIAQGEISEVYRAGLIDDSLNRIFILKIIRPEWNSNAEVLQRFKSELKLRMSFNHPSIVYIYESGEVENQPYNVTERVDGKNLLQLMPLKQPFHIELAAFIIEQAASGLNYVHSSKDKTTGHPWNIVHRNICPQHILISFEGNVKLIGFSIATAETNSEPIRTTRIKGKPSYVSPEIISGEPLDGRSDIFALGIVLWELLTGKVLFGGKDDLAKLKLIEACNTTVKPPSMLNPKVPKEMDDIVLKCLAKDRKKRWESAEELQRALHNFIYAFRPEFDPSDLTYYMKKLFKNEIVEDQKQIQRLKEKAKLVLDNYDLSQIAEKSENASVESKNNIENNIDGIDHEFLEPLEIGESVHQKDWAMYKGENEHRIHSSLRKLIATLSTAFAALKISVDPLEIETLASIIHQVYSAKYRRYHNLNHIFSMLEMGETKPIAVLAILFHDLVYVNVDKRIHPLIAVYLPDFTFQESWSCTLPDIDEESIKIVNGIFGFKVGHTLTPTTGLNEYLSAVIATRILKKLNPWEMISISACIEATIPFRSKINGHTPSEHLLRRIKQEKLVRKIVNRSTDSEDLLKTTIEVSNRDLQGFYSQDSAKFISNTWDLVLESNPIFRNPLYTVKQYRSAIQKVERFHSSLTPERIFSSYDLKDSSISVAEQKQMADRLTWTWLNLDIENLYLRIQLVTHAILEALTELSGGDAPLTLLLGESPTELNSETKAPIELYLNYSLPENNDGVRCVVHDLLRFGKADVSGVVFMRSPLASFIYERLREKQFEAILFASKQMSEGEISPKTLLKLVPKPLLENIIDAISAISWTRKAILDSLKFELGLSERELEPS